MTRVIVYSAALVVFVAGKISSPIPSLTFAENHSAATAMTFSSIFIPNWISWDADGSTGHFHKTIGLHRSCTSVGNKCQHFPQYEDCHGTDRYFCSMWRSVGFMMSFAAVLESVTILTYCVVILGGKQKRERGWKVLTFMLMLVGIIQCAAMAIVVCNAWALRSVLLMMSGIPL
jgi:hypothetical protein